MQDEAKQEMTQMHKLFSVALFVSLSANELNGAWSRVMLQSVFTF